MNQRIHILVVDDELQNRVLLEEFLFEYDVLCAENGVQMWEILAHNIPALILMDISMPGDDGFTLAKKLRKNEKYKDIPIIFISSRIDGYDIEEGFEIGAFDYVKKPFDRRELESRIKHALQNFSTEKELRQKSFAATKIIESMSDGLIIVNDRGFIIDSNPALIEMMNVKSEKVILNKHIDSLFNESNFFSTFSQASPTLKIEGNLKISKTNSIPTLVSVSYLSDNEADISGFICVVHDISKQKLTEQMLLEAKVKAEKADKLKSQFLANISHEIRTPMNSIVGFSELLLDAENDYQTISEYVSVILQNCERLVRLIDSILDISVIESGTVLVSKQSVNINLLLDDLATTAQILKSRYNRDSIEITIHNLENISNIHFESDYQKLYQILSNFLSNAIKYTKVGSVELSCRIDNVLRTITFVVQDTGMGIPSEKINSIFDRFSRLETPGAENIEGAGLGLAISKTYADLLGGTIAAGSVFGKGTTMSLQFTF